MRVRAGNELGFNRERRDLTRSDSHEVENSSRACSRRVLVIGYLAIFASGWIIGRGGGNASTLPVVTREAKQVQVAVLPSVQEAYKPYTSIAVSTVLAQRPNWRTDYELSDWLPRWLPEEAVLRWQSQRNNETHKRALDVEAELGRDVYFWKSLVDPSNGWKATSSSFTYAIANNGFGHRLGNLAFSYLCNVIPNRKQQIIFWKTPGNDSNGAWHALFEDSPLLTGAPRHWKGDHKFKFVNKHRQQLGQQGEIRAEKGLHEGADKTHCDYNMYFPNNCGGGMCSDFNFSRDTWLLRFAQEPSTQEFYMLLRAQLRQQVKDKIASFIEENFPKDKIVVGVHVRSGNGKDDGAGDFDKKRRGDWLHDVPAAIAMVRKHARMVAYSIINRYNQGASAGLNFDANEYDPELDDEFRIFLATDSTQVLEEFRRQDPNVLFVPQERMKVGAGVPINQPLKCQNMTTSECSVHAEEAMFMDAMIMSSCDVALAESFSNWIYTLPATLRLAEGRIFCETGRAALGVKEQDSIYGPASWWAHPPPNTMPVRCYQGAWAARDRSNLMAVEGVS